MCAPLRDGAADLMPWAGKSITLRLWVGLGPKKDTTCDRHELVRLCVHERRPRRFGPVDDDRPWRL